MEKRINIGDTRFIFETNFAGDPRRDPKYHSTSRRGNIVIPDPELAEYLRDEGCNVKLTKPREGEEEGFRPTFFMPILLNYDSSYPPKVYLKSGAGEPVLLGPDTVGELDEIRVANVDVVLSPWRRQDGISMYVDKMYVTQDIDSDPFAARYFGRG